MTVVAASGGGSGMLAEARKLKTARRSHGPSVCGIKTAFVLWVC